MNPSPDRIRIGLIGCGLVAQRHATWLAAEPRAEIRLCYDPSHSAAKSLAADFAPTAAVEADEAAAFRHDDLDAVILCSPTLKHYEQVCRALDCGWHVLCEKPLTPSRDEILDLVERHAWSGRILSIAHQRRYKTAYATARRELNERADRYGPLQSIHVFVCERWQQTITGTWRDDPRVGAGYFGDAGIHQIDVMHFITGHHAKSLFAASNRWGSQVEIVTRVVAELTGGVGLSAHFVGNSNHYREDMHFHCRDADLLLRNEEVYRAQGNQVERITDLVPDSNPDRGFLDAIESGQPTVSPPEIALPIHDWTQAVLRSVREGRVVTVGT